MSGTPGQNRVLDHKEIFGEIVSELNESDDSAPESPAVETAEAARSSAAPQSETVPIATPALVPAVNTSPDGEKPAEEVEPPSAPASRAPEIEESAPGTAPGSKPDSAGDSEIACWVDTTLSLVRRSAARAADEPPAIAKPPEQADGTVVDRERRTSGGPSAASGPGSQTESPAERPTELEPPDTVAAEEMAGVDSSADADSEEAETPEVASDATGRSFLPWRVLVVAVLVGLLAGALAALLTTRLLHGSWLPQPAATTSQSTVDRPAYLETSGVDPSEQTASDPDDRWPSLQDIFTSSTGNAAVVFLGALQWNRL